MFDLSLAFGLFVLAIVSSGIASVVDVLTALHRQRSRGD